MPLPVSRYVYFMFSPEQRKLRTDIEKNIGKRYTCGFKRRCMLVERCKKIFGASGADKLAVTSPDLRFYLTGFYSSDGMVLADEKGACFYTDARYLEAASAALSGSGIAVAPVPEGGYYSLVGCKKLAVALSKITAEEYIALSSEADALIDCTPAFTEAMGVKDEAELSAIERSCRIADRAFTDMLGAFKEGMSENDAAAELEYRMRRYGASRVRDSLARTDYGTRADLLELAELVAARNSLLFWVLDNAEPRDDEESAMTSMTTSRPSSWAPFDVLREYVGLRD